MTTLEFMSQVIAMTVGFGIAYVLRPVVSEKIKKVSFLIKR